MAKIRPVHPDIWTDDDVVSLSPWARLLFIGLWNFACDNGHLEDRSRQIKRRVLPFDDVNVGELLREVAGVGLVDISDGWITIPGAVTRWRLDLRYWKGCSKPGCVKPEPKRKREPRRAPVAHPAGVRRAPVADGDGDGDGDSDATTSPDTPPASSLDPMLAGLKAAMGRYTKLGHIRFDATPVEKVYRIRRLIEIHGDERLVDVALKLPEGAAHVGWFLEGWEALPHPGQRLAAVTPRARCVTHDWVTLTTGGTCSACASEQKAAR